MNKLLLAVSILTSILLTSCEKYTELPEGNSREATYTVSFMSSIPGITIEFREYNRNDKFLTTNYLSSAVYNKTFYAENGASYIKVFACMTNSPYLEKFLGKYNLKLGKNTDIGEINRGEIIKWCSDHYYYD